MNKNIKNWLFISGICIVLVNMVAGIITKNYIFLFLPYIILLVLAIINYFKSKKVNSSKYHIHLKIKTITYSLIFIFSAVVSILDEYARIHNTDIINIQELLIIFSAICLVIYMATLYFEYKEKERDRKEL